MTGEDELRRAVAAFEFGGDLVALVPIGLGHINDTYIATVNGGARFVVQRINREVFRDVAALMSNFSRVTEHLQAKGGRTLELAATRGGASFYRDPQSGECWRAFGFVERTRGGTHLSSARDAFQAGFAFGEFARRLADLPAPPLHESIADFHNTPKRYADLLSAVAEDRCGRAAGAHLEVESALAGERLAWLIADAGTAGRVVHNDAKVENVLFDVVTGDAVCVVDLDTVMPGSLLHDFGDLVRSAAATAGEEETELSAVGVSLERFRELAAGFLSGCGGLLSPGERELLVDAGSVIALEQALRFLTDHLQGDRYYRIGRPGQNLDRARNQLRLVEVLQLERDALRGCLDKC